MSLPLRRFTGVVYRAHNPHWAYAQESGEGARIHGGRFNRQGMPTLYTSVSLETAWLEAQQGFAFKAQPMTMCAYTVDCEGVLDLTSEAVCEQVGVSIDALAAPWEHLARRRQTPPTWLLAERFIEDAAAAIIVPSFARGATQRDSNVVFWRWSIEPPHQVRVIDDFGRPSRPL